MSREATLNHFLMNEEEKGLGAILPASDSSRDRQSEAVRLDWRQVTGAVLVVVGFVAVVAGWVGVSGTSDTASQLSYMTSGGLGGMGLIAIGVLLLVSFEHTRDRVALRALESRLSDLEEAVVVELGAGRSRDARVG